MAARLRVVFVVSTQFEDTREFLRRAAATKTLDVGLVKGDASLDEAGTALAQADRIWFEGTGPLLARLAETDATGEAILRIAADEVAALPAPAMGGLISHLVVPTRAAAEAVCAAGLPPGRACVHVVEARGCPAVQAHRLGEILTTRAGDLPRPTWQRIAAVGDVCRGDVLITGAAPRELAAYLETSVGCRAATDAAALPDGTADAVVLWQDLPAARAAERLREALACLRPGGTIVAATHPSSFPDDLAAEAVARALEGAVPGSGPARVSPDGCVVSVVAGAPGAQPPAPPRVEAAREAPLVSAIVPVYNGQDVIDRSLWSLRGQTYRNLEILVVDDGSTDGTAAAVKRHATADPRVRYVRKDHSGRPETRNTGIREARGEYIAWLDADDEALPNRIRAQVEAAIRHPAADLIHGDGLFMRPSGALGEHRRYPDLTAATAPAHMLRGCQILNTALMLPRDLYAHLGLYDATFPRGQDYEFFVRCALAGGLQYVRIAAPLVRVHQLPLDRPELLPIRLETYDRLASRLIERFGLEGLVDEAGRAAGEDPRLNVGRVLVRKALARAAPPGHALLARAEGYLSSVLGDAALEEQAEALALLARLAEYRGETKTAQGYRRRAHLMTAPVSASRYATAPDGKGE